MCIDWKLFILENSFGLKVKRRERKKRRKKGKKQKQKKVQAEQYNTFRNDLLDDFHKKINKVDNK